jgi:hypothetical protein
MESINMQARINDSAKACMLAYAVGEDLDQFAANNGVERLTDEWMNGCAAAHSWHSRGRRWPAHVAATCFTPCLLMCACSMPSH